MTTSGQFPWNLVARNLSGHELLRKNIRGKIARLEAHLKPFPAEAIHLHIALERQVRTGTYIAAIALRLPGNIVRSEKSGDDLTLAFDEAVREIASELELLKLNVPVEKLWKRNEPHEPAPQTAVAGFNAEPQAEGHGPQSYEEVVRELLRRRYDRLVRHARRLICHDEEAGDIPPGTIDSCDVVDEAARHAEARDHAGQKPREINWHVWLYSLVHEELRRQRRLIREKQATEISAEQPAVPSEFDEDSSHTLEEFAVNEIAAQARAQRVASNRNGGGSVEVVTEKEMLQLLDQDLKSWPRPERETFELGCVEGLDPREIALVTLQPETAVRDHITFIQHRLRYAALARKAA